MRLVTWNCNMALPRKWSALRALKPDVAVVQECASPERLGSRIADLGPGRCLWTGDNPNKGMALFAFGHWRLEPMGDRLADADYFLPARAVGPAASFSLLGAWSTWRAADRLRASPGPLNNAMGALETLAASGDLIVAGDFNHNVRWDKPGWAWNHGASVERLERLGLESAYHAERGLDQGAEAEPTIYWRNRTADGPSYHIDYAFIPAGLPKGSWRVTIGSHADWVAKGLSDHVPVVVDIEDGALASLTTGSSRSEVAA